MSPRCALSAQRRPSTLFTGFAHSAQDFGFRMWPLPAPLDTARSAPVSTTVGLGIGTTGLSGAIRHPLPEDPVGVTPFDPAPHGQRPEVVQVHGQQLVRI